MDSEKTRQPGHDSTFDLLAPQGTDGDLYRKEALEILGQGDHRQGELLRISPAWTRWAYSLLIVFFLAMGVFLLIGRVSQYAEGPAVVRVEGRDELTAMTGGTVTALEVATGQSVVSGQVLARFYDAQEHAELDRVRREFELQLVNYLKNPSDAGIRQGLIALRTQRGLAEARVEQRIIRAPRPGLVGDIHVRPGQVVSAGETVLSLLDARPSVSLIAMLPGHYRPQLRPGMPLRLELAGYRYTFENMTIESLGDEVIGPQAARRYLGAEIADSISIAGPVVVVHARLPASTFVAGDRAYAFHDGMHGRAEVRLRSDRILVTLVPALEALWGRRDG